MGIDSLGKNYEAFATRTGAAGRSAYQEQFVVLPDSWRELVKKPNKTQADIDRIDSEYKKGFINFGQSYIEHLDKTYGNDNGELTIDEFVKSQMAPLSDEYKNDAEFIQAAKNSFHNINVDGGKTLNAKEITALLSMFDMDVEKGGGINGKIKVYDTLSFSLNLIESPNSESGKIIKERISERYQSIFSK
ncbi:hypothetical protein J6A34_00405 [bacterium]|nr:hypothetical protein [bacterium]